MGQKCNCTVETRAGSFEGKALLETSELLFRGGVRLNIPFKDVRRATAVDGQLHVSFGGDTAVFHIGVAAAKWAAKILNPPSRLHKLGVKPGMRLRWIGPPDEDFEREVNECGATIVRTAPDIIFFVARDASALSELTRIPAGPVWVVYPKGITDVRERDVLDAARAAGLVDTKVASFSPTHTALKFIPKAARRK